MKKHDQKVNIFFKWIKSMNFLVLVYTSQDFKKTQPNFAQSHDCMRVTFRSSVSDAREIKAHWGVGVRAVVVQCSVLKFIY